MRSATAGSGASARVWIDAARFGPLIGEVPLRTLTWPPLGWLAGLGIWTALALLSALERIIWLVYRDAPVPLAELTLRSLVDWYSCAVFLPFFVAATRLRPLAWGHLATRLPLHAGITLAAVVGRTLLLHEILPYLPNAGETTLRRLFAGSFISESIAFGAVVGVLHAAEYYRRFRERETLAAQLQARLSDAQLRALRAQLNPHFLFNTLNAATALLYRDPDAADAMLTRLGELLRLTLRAEPDHETPLHEEMALLERYLGIMRLRFGDRVTIRCTVDALVSQALVPSFILQPIVENAFEHGVARLQRHGLIQIDAAAVDGALELTVRDNGPGEPSPSRSIGVGLSNTRSRLTELYGARGSVELTSTIGGGTTVRVRLPLRTAAQAA